MNTAGNLVLVSNLVLVGRNKAAIAEEPRCRVSGIRFQERLVDLCRGVLGRWDGSCIRATSNFLFFFNRVN